MGQKVNPNLFNFTDKIPKVWSSKNKLEYSFLIKHNILLLALINRFFEKKNLMVQNCCVLFHKESMTFTLFLSFFPVRFKKKKKKKYIRVFDSNLHKICMLNSVDEKKFYFLIDIFKVLGYFSFKRLIFRNLMEDVKRKKPIKNYKIFSSFRRESFYKSGCALYSLFFCGFYGLSNLLNKFISINFKLLHRSKKSIKFLFFIRRFVDSINKNILLDKNNFQLLKGLKIQIKGRFRRSPRTKKRIYEVGQMPLQTVNSRISYSLNYINTSYGVFSVKVWVCF